MIKENKHTGGFRPKFGYDVDDNGYLIPVKRTINNSSNEIVER